MKATSLEHIAAWCDGQMNPKYKNIAITGVNRDSRTVQDGEMYIAIPGNRVDGHQFIPGAMERGAAAVLAEREPAEDIPAVIVDNSVKALGQIAAGYRRTLHTKVIAITGSVGKTTTKEMLAAMLSRRYKTGKTPENYNNNIGLPLTLLSLEEDCETAVLELGMNHFGEMSLLTAIARPDTVLLTNIGTMHIEHLGSRQGILKAKLEILEGLNPGGVAFFNGDEPLLWHMAGRTGCRTVYYGLENPECEVTCSSIEQRNGGTEFTVCGYEQTFRVFLPLEGIHNVYNAMGAITVALEYGVTAEEIQAAMAAFSNTGMRQNTYEENGFTIIDDSYNAGPESMEAALTVLGDKKTEGKHIAVLGSMLELGHRSAAEHYRIGRLAATKADRLLTYGEETERIITGAITGGMEQKRAMQFDTHAELVNTLRNWAEPGDVILFKGSRGTHMDEALKQFLEVTKEN